MTADHHGAQLRDTIEAALLGSAPDGDLEQLLRRGVLDEALPELCATVALDQEVGRRHKNVWAHTKQVVAQARRDPVVRWGALLHDIGKVPTRRVDSGGRVTFHGHAEVGAQMFAKISQRLDFSESLAAGVGVLIAQHQRANQYEPSWTDSAVRRFARQAGQHLDALLALSRADITSASESKRRQARDRLDELEARIAALREIDARSPRLPSGLGHALMERFGRSPGVWLGPLQRALLARVERRELQADQPCAYYVEAVELDPELLAKTTEE